MSDTATSLTLAGCIYEIYEKETGARHPCGQKTVSPTYPYCYKHVSKIGSPSDRRFERYQDHMPGIVRKKYQEQLEDTRPSDLVPELANIRALLNLHYERIANTITPEGKIEMTNKDLVIILEIIDQIRRVAETNSKINPEKYIPLADVERILRDMIEIIRSSIPQDQVQLREKIAAAINKYCMEELASRVVDTTSEKAHGKPE